MRAPVLTSPPTPMVFYGTITRNNHGEKDSNNSECLSFLAAAPLTIVPMRSGVFTILFDKMDESDVRRAQDESNEVYQIVSMLVPMNGLVRLWVTPSNLIVQGDQTYFDTIAVKIQAVMKEVLGAIDFREVPHNEARPLFFF